MTVTATVSPERDYWIVTVREPGRARTVYRYTYRHAAEAAAADIEAMNRYQGDTDHDQA